MAWRRPGDKPLYKPMMVSLLTHICVTRPQWVKQIKYINLYFFALKHEHLYNTEYDCSQHISDAKCCIVEYLADALLNLWDGSRIFQVIFPQQSQGHMTSSKIVD